MRPMALDHFVLTVASVEESVRFYRDVLGCEIITFGVDRKAIRFGRQKINLHQAGAEVTPHAAHPVQGAGDFCVIYPGTIEAVMDVLVARGIEPLLGPVDRTGAMGSIRSVYIRDPDDNLVELAVYSEAGPA